MTATGQRAAPPGRWPLLVAACLTVLAAGVFDLSAGEAPTHAATLGVIAALAAALRVRLAGRAGLVPFVCGCVVSQPVLHYAAKLLPHPSVEHGTGVLPGPADLLIAALQTMAILVVVGILTFAEQILLALAAGAVRLFIVRIRSIRPLPASARFVITVAPAIELLSGRYHPGSIARRGPPVGCPAC